MKPSFYKAFTIYILELLNSDQDGLPIFVAVKESEILTTLQGK
ncbi:hypothetical protein BH11BAC5_BH11BAC5_11360 [soil metagenome]|jgi:hypothetical protein